MKIKELNLIGFGKFSQKKLELKNGINVIYGENEAGKSTVHSFINGMFYGFLRPYIKTTRYLDEHDKYNPWAGGPYSGIIKFNYKDEDYILERDFTRGNERTTVFLGTTGEDITQQIDNGNRGRILQPGHELFGFNDSIFSNTISIKQLGSKTEDELANEVRDRIINTSTSLDDNLSIEKAIEDLNNSLKEIGSDRAPTSRYGRSLKKLGDLKKERQRILSYKDNYDQALEDNNRMDESLTRAEEELISLKEDLADQIILEKAQVYKEAKNLINQIEVLKLKRDPYEKYKDISMDDYTALLSLNNRLENSEEKFEKLKEDLEENEKMISQARTMVGGNAPQSQLADDYINYENLDEEKSKLHYIKGNNKRDFLKRDLEDGEKAVKTNKLLLIVSLILTLSLGALTLVSFNYISLTLTLVFTLSLIGGFSSLKTKKSRLDQLENELSSLEKEYKRINTRVKEIEGKQEEILLKYKLTSKVELSQLYDREKIEIYRKEERKRDLEERMRKKETILAEMESLELEIGQGKESLSKDLKNKGMSNLAEMKDALEKKEIYQTTDQDIKNKNIHLGSILKDYSLEKLEEDLKTYPKNIEEISAGLSSSDIGLEIEEKNKEIGSLRVEKSGIESKLNSLNQEIGKLLELDEEIDRTEKKIQDMDRKKETILLARETIEDLSKTIHKQFAPSINKNVGKILSRITDSKYERLRIDDKFNISLVNPDNGQSIDINSLSGGTIDQLYFALRFGIIDSIENDSPPLILDDCFIQYDDSRLSHMMEYLGEVAKDRQIILFTCHKREIKELKRRDLDFNYLKLGEA